MNMSIFSSKFVCNNLLVIYHLVSRILILAVSNSFPQTEYFFRNFPLFIIAATNEIIPVEQSEPRRIQLASSTKMAVSNFMTKLKVSHSLLQILFY